MTDQVIGSNDHLRVTFVKKNGRLVPLPDGLMMMVPTKILPLLTTPLLSLATKARMGLELLRAPKLRGEDESVADFIREHYGQEAVDYLAEPLLSGIYGGDPGRLSVRAVLPRFVELSEKYGSLTKGVLASRAQAPKTQGPPAPLFRTLRGGLGDLVDALTRAIALHTTVRQAKAEAIERTAHGYRVRIEGDWLESSHVVLACEAHAATPLIAPLDPRAAELLGGVGYSSSMTVALGYNAADFASPPIGFGFLIPKKERRRLVACTWIGTKFPNRVPADKIVARCFVGGAGDAAILDEPDDVIIATVTDELREVAGVTARPIFTRIARWPRAMAQYPVGHIARNKELESRIANLAGLYLAGNAYQGIGIPDCIRMGRAAAEKIS
jgi:oxygen-dependent protoporphyrinogen oxidase